MIELLKPLILNENYVGNQLFAMIDISKKPASISKDTYMILRANGKNSGANMHIDEKGDIFVLTSVNDKDFGVAKIQKQFYKKIMARTVTH